MNLSEINVKEMTEDQKYDLVIKGISCRAADIQKSTKKTAIVILGAAPEPIRRRMIKAAELYKKGYGQYLIFSGGSGWQRTLLAESTRKGKIDKARVNIPDMDEYTDEDIIRMTEAEFMDKVAIFFDIPEEAIIYEYYSETTPQNAKYTKFISKQDEFERYIVVTDFPFVRRAVQTFKKVFPENVEIIGCATSIDLDRIDKENIFKKYRLFIEGEAEKLVKYCRSGDLKDMRVDVLLENIEKSSNDDR
jgi:uncharacterized SAM-binding protein YcdF (DUF218 family)